MEQVQQRNNILDGKTMIPVGVIFTILTLVIGGVMYVEGKEDSMREEVARNYVRQEEFRPFARDVAEMKADIKKLLINQGIQ